MSCGPAEGVSARRAEPGTGRVGPGMVGCVRRWSVPLLAGFVLLAGCGGGASSDPSVAPSGAGASSPTPPGPTSQEDPPGRRERIIEAIRSGTSAFVVIPKPRYVPMWDRLGPRDPDYVFDARSPNGGHAPMLIADARVDERDRAWFRVYLPIRPNGTTGWVREDDVRVRERHERIEVDLSRRVLEHYVEGDLVSRLEVGVGTDRYPTATGTFYVWVKVPYDPPHPAYGIFALGLSGFSPVLSDWPGEGRMAIHGTPHAGDRGRAVSHGCVRVWNPDMESLVDVPLGTPVIIRP